MREQKKHKTIQQATNRQQKQNHNKQSGGYSEHKKQNSMKAFGSVRYESCWFSFSFPVLGLALGVSLAIAVYARAEGVSPPGVMHVCDSVWRTLLIRSIWLYLSFPCLRLR